MTLDAAQDFIALCNGWVIMGDRVTNQIRILNVFDGTVSRTFQLSAVPGDLRLDAAKALLFVTLEATTQLARIDLVSGIVTYIPLTKPGFRLCIGNSNKVFVCTGTGPYGDDGTTSIVDELSGAVSTVTLPNGGYTVYDKVHDRLFIGGDDGSPADLRSYSFDSATTTLSAAQTASVGSFGADLTVSLDGKHIAYITHGGAGMPYSTVWDQDPMDLNSIAGSWITGPYIPYLYSMAGDFSQDSSLFVMTEGLTMMVFDMNYVLTKRSDTITGGFSRMRISGGNGYIFGISGIYPGNYSQFYWMTYP